MKEMRPVTVCNECKDFNKYHPDDERCEVCRFYDAETNTWHLDDKEKIDAELILSS